MSTCISCGAANHSNTECPTCQENWVNQYKTDWGKPMINKLIRVVYLIIASIFMFHQPPFWYAVVVVLIIAWIISGAMDINQSSKEND